MQNVIVDYRNDAQLAICAARDLVEQDSKAKNSIGSTIVRLVSREASSDESTSPKPTKFDLNKIPLWIKAVFCQGHKGLNRIPLASFSSPPQKFSNAIKEMIIKSKGDKARLSPQENACIQIISKWTHSQVLLYLWNADKRNEEKTVPASLKAIGDVLSQFDLDFLKNKSPFLDKSASFCTIDRLTLQELVFLMKSPAGFPAKIFNIRPLVEAKLGGVAKLARTLKSFVAQSRMNVEEAKGILEKYPKVKDLNQLLPPWMLDKDKRLKKPGSLTWFDSVRLFHCNNQKEFKQLLLPTSNHNKRFISFTTTMFAKVWSSFLKSGKSTSVQKLLLTNYTIQGNTLALSHL
jgi:hypothetical protein